DWDESVARTTVSIYLVFPSAFFLSGVYSESVLLAMAASAILAGRRRQWELAGLFAALAMLARPIGFVTLVPVATEYLSVHGFRRSSVNMRLVGLVTPILLAGVGYLLVSSWLFGDPLASIAGQVSIRGSMSAPWQPFIRMWMQGPHWHSFDNSLLDASLAI